LHSKDSSLNREGNDVKGPHESAHKLGIVQEETGEEHGPEPALKGAWAGRPSRIGPGACWPGSRRPLP
jgi:hypothetical protein